MRLFDVDLETYTESSEEEMTRWIAVESTLE